jgi:hypothetical protein
VPDLNSRATGDRDAFPRKRVTHRPSNVGIACLPAGGHTPARSCSACRPAPTADFYWVVRGGESAATVEIAFPDDAGTLTTPVADSGFFGVAIPDAAMQTMMIATQPGPKDPPTKDGGPIMGFVPERAAISVAASDAKRCPNRLRCPRDGARGRNRNRAGS